MARFPALPLFTDAYLADTNHLTDAEHGRYLLLLMTMWRIPGCRLPNDDQWLARHFRRSVEQVQSELRPIIEEFMQTHDCWIMQKRLQKEWTWLTEKRQKNSDAAKSRWDQEKGAYERNAPKRNAPYPTPPIKPPAPLNEKTATEEAFERFKAAYPKRLGSPAWSAARKAFVVAIKDGTDPEVIIVAARRYAVAPGTKVGTEFVAMATTWLHQKRWEDYPGGNGADEQPGGYRSHWEHIKAKMREHT